MDQTQIEAKAGELTELIDSGNEDQIMQELHPLDPQYRDDVAEALISMNESVQATFAIDAQGNRILQDMTILENGEHVDVYDPDLTELDGQSFADLIALLDSDTYASRELAQREILQRLQGNGDAIRAFAAAYNEQFPVGGEEPSLEVQSRMTQIFAEVATGGLGDLSAKYDNPGHFNLHSHEFGGSKFRYFESLMHEVDSYINEPQRVAQRESELEAIQVLARDGALPACVRTGGLNPDVDLAQIDDEIEDMSQLAEHRAEIVVRYASTLYFARKKGEISEQEATGRLAEIINANPEVVSDKRIHTALRFNGAYDNEMLRQAFLENGGDLRLIAPPKPPASQKPVSPQGAKPPFQGENVPRQRKGN